VRKLSPEEKAHRLLLRHLTDEQRWTYRYRGYFDFTGSEGGKYRLVRQSKLLRRDGLLPSHPLIELDENNPGLNSSRSTHYLARNIFTTDRRGVTLPEGDNLLAIKVILEASERHRSVACTYAYTKVSVKALEGRKRRTIAH
jgi:hypothetical protein